MGIFIGNQRRTARGKRVMLAIAIAAVICGGSAGAIALSGCSSKVAQAPATSYSLKTAEFTQANMLNEFPDDTVLARPEYSQADVQIKYPQITGMSDIQKQAKINNLIMNDIWGNTMGYYIQSDEATHDELTSLMSINTMLSDAADGSLPVSILLSYTIDYQVTLQTESLLSIVYTGDSYTFEAAHGITDHLSITIDLDSAQKLAITDFVQLDQNFANKLLDPNNIIGPLSQDVYQNGLADGVLAPEDLEVYGLEPFDAQTLVSALSQPGGNSGFYLTPDALVVSFDVPHVIGSYVLVQIAGDFVSGFSP